MVVIHMSLKGSTNEQQIWNFLRSSGLNNYGTAGLMGNLYAESGLSSTNLQNSFEKKLGYTDESYTASVDCGIYTRFVSDSAGYGIAQWTYSARKNGLLNYARNKGVSIGDLELQLNYLMIELESEYVSLLSLLKTASSVLEASNAVLKQFEKPADMSTSVQQKRASYGQAYYDKYAESIINASSGNTIFSVGLSSTLEVQQSNEYASPMSMIDYTQISPYIITLSRKSKNIDMKRLKSIGVIGVMIESGSLYDSIHMMQDYRNPELESQVQSAVKADLPFAFYHEVRSRNLEEANKELLELKLCIQKYNPTLGVWLKLLFNNSTKTNNDIVDLYQKYLTNLGLKNKIGFYVTYAQLKRIDWESRCDDWYLWIDDHVSDLSEFQRVLGPEFFMTGYPSSGTSIASPLNITNVSSIYTKQLFVGDSRTVGMSQAVPGLSTIAKVSSGYTFLSAQVSTIKRYTDTNIVFWHGVNDLQNISKYIELYNQLQSAIGSNNHIYVVSVTQCSGSYLHLNQSIIEFNSTMKSRLDGRITYIDVYSYLEQIGFNTVDGLHYDNATYIAIYNYILSAIR